MKDNRAMMKDIRMMMIDHRRKKSKDAAAGGNRCEVDKSEVDNK